MRRYEVAAADVTKIRNVVIAAAGIDPTRGDVVSVEAIPFNPALRPSRRRRGAVATTVFGIPVSVLIPLGVVALLVAVGAALLALRRRRPALPSAGRSCRPSIRRWPKSCRRSKSIRCSKEPRDSPRRFVPPPT